MRLVEFGLFLLLLSNFSSFVLCKNLYNDLLHVVVSPFYLNYLPTLASFSYICTTLFLLAPLFQMHGFFFLSHFMEKQEGSCLVMSQFLHITMLFSTAHIRSLQGKTCSVSVAGSDGKSSPQWTCGTATMPQARTVRPMSVPLSIQRTELLNYIWALLNSAETWFLKSKTTLLNLREFP